MKTLRKRSAGVCKAVWKRFRVLCTRQKLPEFPPGIVTQLSCKGVQELMDDIMNQAFQVALKNLESINANNVKRNTVALDKPNFNHTCMNLSNLTSVSVILIECERWGSQYWFSDVTLVKTYELTPYYKVTSPLQSLMKFKWKQIVQNKTGAKILEIFIGKLSSLKRASVVK